RPAERPRRASRRLASGTPVPRLAAAVELTRGGRDGDVAGGRPGPLALDDVLDGRDLVPGHGDEERLVVADALVVAPQHRKAGEAVGRAALADDLQVGVDGDVARERVDLLVDRAEERFVEADAA